MIFAAVAAGLLFPVVGNSFSIWQPDRFVAAAVFIIFLLQGFVLPLQQLAKGILHWRFHVVVLVFNFVVAPALAWSLFASPWSPVDRSSAMGFLYLGILPTTISSAVALTVAAKGNAAAALFGVTLSNLAGIVMVPFGIAFWMSAGGQSAGLSFLDALIRVAQLIALPMLVGQILRLALSGRGSRIEKKVGSLSQWLIVFIVWIVFSQSAARGEWSDFDIGTLLWTGAGVVLYFAAMSGVFYGLAGRMQLAAHDKIAAYYCATQKGLATGAPMAVAFFLSASGAGQVPSLGLILLPLMLYHPLQLIVGAWLASRFSSGERES